MLKSYILEVGGKKFIVEIGGIAEQAQSSVLVRLGQTVVLVTITVAQKPREGIDFFPLVVDFEERFYAAGRLKKSRFIKREGRPSDEAIITARMIDRTIRPFFDSRIRNDVQVVVTCLSFDGENDPDIPALLGTSIALSISGLPWNGFIAPLRIGYKEGKFIYNPTYEERQKSSFDFVVCLKENLVSMVELEAKEVGENILLESLKNSTAIFKKITDFIKLIKEEVKAKEKLLLINKIDDGLIKFTKKFLKDRIEKTIYIPEKALRKETHMAFKEEFFNEAKKEFELTNQVKDDLNFLFEDYVSQIVHKNAIEKGLRPDGRKPKEIRAISCKVGLFERTHGSALFERGLTQALSIVTLAGPGEEQYFETIESALGIKRFIHHYNFPPYSVGEVSPLRGPGRREIGHGILVEKALEQLMPQEKEFPYTIRVVSEILSSNGSTSMASVCAASLALFEAAVPLERHIAGISIGLMSKLDFSRFIFLTDIQGPEDHHGDMDFKVAGTEVGITAIQMDVKIPGITFEMFDQALREAREGRLKILKILNQTISSPRKLVSLYAPKVLSININPEKIKDLIGPGGRNINSIIEKTGVAIQVKEDGKIYVTSTDLNQVKEAIKIIKEITREFQIGDIVKAKVSAITDYGAFIEFGNHLEGLIHISNLVPGKRVRRVEDILKVGDQVYARLSKIDEFGRLGFSLVKKGRKINGRKK